jgi:myo-inositol-1(or 4)-monophosphatase
MTPENDLNRIRQALLAARQSVSAFTPGRIASEKKAGGDPVTQADLILDKVLKEMLLGPDEGWLSEETTDDRERLKKRRVWIVDSIDGTREFIEGIPEWCISVGLMEDGQPVVGGILNPATDQLFLGTVGLGVTLNGKSVKVSDKQDLAGARILASRSEIRKGQWSRFEKAPFEVIPCGSVAYKLACVSAGLAEATWTLFPKNEWDIAAGVCLVYAAGGQAVDLSGNLRRFNQPNPLLNNLLAGNKPLLNRLKPFLAGQPEDKPR